MCSCMIRLSRPIPPSVVQGTCTRYSATAQATCQQGHTYGQAEVEVPGRRGPNSAHRSPNYCNYARTLLGIYYMHRHMHIISIYIYIQTYIPIYTWIQVALNPQRTGTRPYELLLKHMHWVGTRWIWCFSYSKSSIQPKSQRLTLQPFKTLMKEIRSHFLDYVDDFRCFRAMSTLPSPTFLV